MTKWSTVKPRLKGRRRRKPPVDEDCLRYEQKVAEDVRLYLEAENVPRSAEQIQRALDYPYIEDAWRALDGPLVKFVTVSGRRRYSISAAK